MHVVIVGPMGVGKSTIGREMAARLDRPLRDSDDDLAAARGISGRELTAREGIGALHRWEADHLLAALSDDEPAVIAAAASVVDDPRVRAALDEPFVVWLRAPTELLVARVLESDHRPDLGPDPAATIARIVEARTERYAEVADLAVDAADVDPVQVGLAVVEALPVGRRLPGPAGPDSVPS